MKTGFLYVVAALLLATRGINANVAVVEDGADLNDESELISLLGERELEEDLAEEPEANRVGQAADSSKPNIVLLLADDFGWANIGYHRDVPTDEVQTPNMDALAADGVKLERVYTYHMCSPSRCALQTGRYAQHVNLVNAAPEDVNPADKVSGYAGIPIPMTTVAEKMKSQGYRTVAIGKWDVGMATPQHTPRGRGYDKSLVYFHHAINYFNCGVQFTAIGEINVCLNRFTDLWYNNGPAKGVCKSYIEGIFADYATVQIRQAAKSKVPLFLFYSSHLVHSPLQVPTAVLNKFAFIDNAQRKRYAAMTYYLDMVVGRLVKALKQSKIYDNTLIIFLSDNGGAIYTGGAANNYPLRAGKYADFEGGIRVNSFASGGLVPVGRRGTASHNLISVADVYSSIIRLGAFGTASPINQTLLSQLTYDPKAAAAGLYQPDSVDTIWGAILGSSVEPNRTEIWLSQNAIIQGQYKLVTGSQPQDIWQGPEYPNSTGPQPAPGGSPLPGNLNFISTVCEKGCLFNVFVDPTEHQDLASSNPTLVNKLKARLVVLNQTLYEPNRGNATVQACKVALNKYDKYYGPFVLNV